MAYKKQKRNSLLRLSKEKRLRLVHITMGCRDIYGKCLEFLERHPSGACEDTLQELEYQMIVWYKSGDIKPYVMVTTTRYVIAKLKKDFRLHWRKKGKHPSDLYKIGYETAWQYFKVPKSNLIVDPFRRQLYVMGIGYMDYNLSIPDLENAIVLKIFVGDPSPHIKWDHLRKD